MKVYKGCYRLSSLFTTGVLFRYLGYNAGNSLGISMASAVAGISILIGLYIFRNYTVDERELKQKYGEYVARQ